MPEGAVEFRVLGPVEVWVRGRQVAPSAAKPRALLAALILDSNRLVPADQLIDVVWGVDAPRTAGNTLQVYVSRLRRMLAAARGVADDVGIEARTPGYLLRVDPQRLDICRFRHLVAAARAGLAVARADLAAGRSGVVEEVRAGVAEADQASALYRQALDLWRGPALADVSSDRLRAASAAALEDEQLTAMEEWLELEIVRGRHAEATSLLRSLVAVHPYRERLRELLMRAMHRSGRSADALAVFRAARATFNADLGIEPGPRLAALHRRILTGGAGETRGAAGRTGRDDLPRDLPDMTGRTTELGYLLDRVRSGGAPAGTVAIDGMAGVGKTTFAIHVAHRVAEHFAVRLFVDLRGHTAGEQPMESRTALGVLLRAVGVPDERLPGELDARAALWRAELAGRRALLVLDNAASTAQVTPLLPGGAGCLALVTSRSRLVGLESAVSLSLDVPPAAEAVALLRAIVGDERATADAAIEEIARLCGRLPLALRVAGARLRHRTAWSAGYLACRLRERQRRLVELTAGDRSVAATFAVSYDHLGEPQRRLFRLLGVVPGAEVDRYQAAVLAGMDAERAEAILEELVDANLMTEPAAGRYTMHDLLREYARSRSEAEEPRAAECLARLLQALVNTASEAAYLLEPLRRCMPPAAGDVPRAGPRLATRAEAMAWLAIERSGLVAAVRYAADAGLASQAWRLADALWHFCYLRGYTDDWINTHRVAQAAARAAGDRQGEAVMAANLGYAYRRLGRLRDALAQLRRALAVQEELGDRERVAAALGKIGTVYESLGVDRVATAYHGRALAIRREIGDRWGEGNTLNNLAAMLARGGRHDEAVTHYRAAIAVFREVGDETGEGRALSNLGDAYTCLGRLDEALRCLERALALRRECGDRRGEANTLANLGNLYRRLDRPDDAIGYLERALAMMRACGDAPGQCEALNDIGAVLCCAGRQAEALARFTEALGIAEASHMRYERDRAQRGLARLAGTGTPEGAGRPAPCGPG